MTRGGEGAQFMRPLSQAPETANRLRVADQGAAVAPLYAADLLGGCLGALLGSLFLLPFLGLPATALLVAGLALVLLLVV